MPARTVPEPMDTSELHSLVEALREAHGAHTALLYGSLADGSAGPESDIDLALFAPIAQIRRDARWYRTKPRPGGSGWPRCCSACGVAMPRATTGATGC